jgi:hypothetical protein
MYNEFRLGPPSFDLRLNGGDGDNLSGFSGRNGVHPHNSRRSGRLSLDTSCTMCHHSWYIQHTNYTIHAGNCPSHLVGTRVSGVGA